MIKVVDTKVAYIYAAMVSENAQMSLFEFAILSNDCNFLLYMNVLIYLIFPSFNLGYQMTPPWTFNG
jgi:hypothetical protein